MSDLPNRLRCKYPNGPMIDGEPKFGWRDFSGPAPGNMTLPSAIMIEAADRIEKLEEALSDTVTNLQAISNLSDDHAITKIATHTANCLLNEDRFGDICGKESE